MARLDQAIRRERARLVALDDTTLEYLNRSYSQVLNRMRADLGNLTETIEAARAAGQPVNPQWLYGQERYRALVDQTERRLDTFYQAAGDRIADAKKQALTLGANAAETLTVASMGAQLATGQEALIRGSFNHVHTAALDVMLDRARDGTPLGDLLAKATGDTLDKVRDTLASGVAQGKNPRWIAAEMSKVSEIPLTRARVIARQEVVGSYRDASTQAYTESPVVRKWSWRSARDETTCPVCWAMDGEEFDDTETLDSHPSCFPAGTVVSGPTPVGATTRRYEGDLVEIRLDGDRFLAVTPNHPILTPRGWVAAGDLREGHDVIRSRRGERDSAGHPDDHERPALIEEVAEALRGAGKVTAGTVPASPENFHGDGVGGDVDVVLADRFLEGGRESSVFEHGREVAFAFRRVALALFAGLGGEGQFLEGSLATAGGSMGGGDVSPVFLGRPCRHHLAVGLGASTDLDPGFQQPRPDRGPGDAQGLGDRALGLAGPIPGDNLGVRQVGPLGRADLGGLDPATFGGGSPEAPVFQGAAETRLAGSVPSRADLDRVAGEVVEDRIVEIRVRRFSGHVHNLQTVDGWYTANSIIVHNCRCTQIPRTVGWDELGIEGMEDSRPPLGPTGPEIFGHLPEAQQRAILGPSKYEAFKRGDLKLADLVAKTSHPDWGGGRRMKSLKELGVNRTTSTAEKRRRS